MSKQKEIKYRFGWGNPHFLLDILESKLSLFEHSTDMRDMIYGHYDGLPAMIETTRKVIKQTIGQDYRHILITNGASGALNLILRRFKAKGGQKVFTTKYGYPSYDSFIERAGLERVKDLTRCPFDFEIKDNYKNIRLIDSPENPTGHQYTLGDKTQDIWDSVYNSKIYTPTPHIIPQHRLMVGSYSKLLGLAGMRIGFIATNDSLIYEDLVMEAKAEYTGISRPSQEMLVEILEKIDLDLFMIQGNRDLCYNKEEFQKIEYLFDGQPVNEIGMFYCIQAEDRAVQVLDRAGVEYIRLDQDTIRLSMGQSKNITKDGINAILKEDKGG